MGLPCRAVPQPERLLYSSRGRRIAAAEATTPSFFYRQTASRERSVDGALAILGRRQDGLAPLGMVGISQAFRFPGNLLNLRRVRRRREAGGLLGGRFVSPMGSP